MPNKPIMRSRVEAGCLATGRRVGHAWRYVRTMMMTTVLLVGCTVAPDGEVSATAAPARESQVSQPTSATPVSAAEASTPPAAEVSPQSPPITVSAENLRAPEAEAARAFVEAVDAQDYAAAWELLGPRSQDALGSQQALEEQRSALTEGWAAWARSPDALIFRSGLLTDTDEDHPRAYSVVTLTGTVTQEGTTEQRTVAAPAWVEYDGSDPVKAWFEPFAEGAPPLQIVDPVESGTVACEDVRIAADVPAKRGGTAISLDGEGLHPDLETDPADPERVTFGLDAPVPVGDHPVVHPAPLSAGEHVVTFAFMSWTGAALYADAVRFTLEGPC